MAPPQRPLGQAGEDALGDQLDRDSLKAGALSGARWVGISRVVAEVLGLAATVVLARLISPAEYGQAVIVLILPMLASILTFEGFGARVVQARVLTREHVGTAVSLSVACGLLLSAAVYFLSPVIADPVFGAGTSELAQLCAPIFLIASFGSVPRALLQRRLDWKGLNLTETIGVLAVAIASVAFALAGLESEALVLGALVGGAVVTVLLLASAPSGPPLWDPPSVMPILRFGSAAALGGLSHALERNVTFLVLAGRASPTAVGLYWRACQLGMEYQSKITGITFRVAKPLLTRAARIEDLREMRHRLVRLNCALIFPLLALLIVLAPDVVPLVFGPDWTGAVEPTRILAVAGLWTTLLYGIDAPLMAVGRPGALAAFYVASMFATGIVTWFTAPLGITAVSLGMCICQFVLLLAGQYFLLSRVVGVPMRDSFGDSAAALVCSAALVAAMLPVAETLRGSLGPLPLTLLIAPLGLAVYVACLRVASPGAWYDLGKLFLRVLGARRVVTRLNRAVQRV